MIAEIDLEYRFLELLRQSGWEIKKASEIARELYSEPLLLNNLKEAIKKINPWIADEDVARVIDEIKNLPSTADGCKQTLEFIKNGISIIDSKEKILKKVFLIDYEDIYARKEKRVNEYLAIEQANFINNRVKIRTDIILYINGIPLVNIELKNPDSLRKNWQDAYNDILNYEEKVPELYKYVQIGVVGDTTFKYFATSLWNRDAQRINEWKEEGDKSAIENICSMLIPEKLLNLIKYYVFFREEHNIKTKVIARYMQYRAAEKIVERVKTGLKQETEKKVGLIWHWQGSGKTLTMIFAANKIYQLPEASNPTIFFILDRQELEDQLYSECNGLSLFKTIEVVSSIQDLKEIIKHSNYSGKRGIFITLIHKFNPNDFEHLDEYFDDLEKEIKRAEKKNEIITTRKNIISFIDEGHRTQYGKLAAQMKKILKNGFRFAFTGTPISEKNRNTYAEFSSPEEKWLDRYFMEESIEDGFTLKIAYQARLTDKVHLRKEELDIFYKSDEEELTDELKREIENVIIKRIGKRELFFENPERIKLIAEDIKNHFNENIRGKYKAMIVTSSRKACTIYYEELLRYFKKEEIEIVMTAGPKEQEKEIENYYQRIKNNYGVEFDQAREKIINNFKQKENPKILIVVDMLVTGFDAPVLQVIYLDKLMKDYRLLQTIARTNRPYKEKAAGLVIDYVGVLGDINKALLDYLRAGESQEYVLNTINEMEKEFVDLLEDTIEFIEKSGVKKGNRDEKSMIRIIKFLFENEENLTKFLSDYKRISRLFEFLGSDIIKIEKLEDFEWLSFIYIFYRKNYESKNDLKDIYIENYFKRTLDQVYKNIEIGEFIKTPEIYFDNKKLEQLHKIIQDEELEAANIIFALRNYILVEKSGNPIYVDLIERIKELIRRWQEEKENYAEIIKQGKLIFEEKNEIEKEQKELNLPDDEFAMYRTLIKAGLNKEQALKSIRDLKNVIDNYLLENIDKLEVQREISKIIRRYLRQQNYGLRPSQLDDINKYLIDDLRVSYGK